MTERTLMISALKANQAHYERMVKLNEILKEITHEDGMDILEELFGETYADKVLFHTLWVVQRQKDYYNKLLNLENEKSSITDN